MSVRRNGRFKSDCLDESWRLNSQGESNRASTCCGVAVKSSASPSKSTRPPSGVDNVAAAPAWGGLNRISCILQENWERVFNITIEDSGRDMSGWGEGVGGYMKVSYFANWSSETRPLVFQSSISRVIVGSGRGSAGNWLAALDSDVMDWSTLFWEMQSSTSISLTGLQYVGDGMDANGDSMDANSEQMRLKILDLELIKIEFWMCNFGQIINKIKNTRALPSYHHIPQ